MLWGQLWWVGTMVTAFVALTPRVYPRFTLTEIAFMSVPVGTIAGAWITFLVSCLLNEISSLSVTISSLIILLIFWDSWRRFSKKIKPAICGISTELRNDWVMWLNCAVWGWFVVPLFNSRFFPEDDRGNVYSGGSCWADMPIHLHMAHSFLYGRNADVSFYDMHSPVFANAKMAYPFLPDWHAAVLNLMGDPMRWAMMTPGVAMFFSLLVLMFSLSRRMVKSNAASIVAIVMVILSGGMGGINLSKHYSFERIMQEFDPIQDDYQDKGSVFWFAFLPHVYLPQRGATFAYPMALTSLLLVWGAIRPAHAQLPTRKPISPATRRSFLIMAGVFAASLPLVQAHSFIALGIVIGVIALTEVPMLLAHPIQAVGWLSAGVLTLLLAVPQLVGFLKTVTEGGPNGKGTFMEVRPIWSPPPFIWPGNFTNFWWFWWRALGPAIPLITMGLFWWGISAARIVIDTSKFVWQYFGGNANVMSLRNGASSPTVEDDPREFDSEDSEGARATEDVTATKVYSYGGVLRKAPTSDSADDLSDLSATIGELYDPVRQFAIQLERIIQRHNRGRVFDTFRFAFAGAVCWMFGNYVMLQPWDRDNCKLLYIALFLCMPLAAKILTFPFEHVSAFQTGVYARKGQAIVKRDDDATGSRRQELLQGYSVMSETLGVPSLGPLKKRGVATVLAALFMVVVPVLLYFACYSGALSVTREYRLYHVLYDSEAREIGEAMREKVPPKSVVVHHDTHLTPAGYYAGRPSLVGYSGWMWSHGYDYHDRNHDRNIIMDHILKDSDPNCYNLLRRWGIRYVLAERPFEWPRDTSRPNFDAELYLDNQLKRIHRAGRYHLLEVLGYGFPPN